MFAHRVSLFNWETDSDEALPKYGPHTQPQPNTKMVYVCVCARIG